VANYRYARGNTPRTVYGQVYTPETITRTEVDQNQELRSGSITVSLPLENPLALLFADYMPPQQVSLVIYGGHEDDSEIVAPFTGIVSSVKRTEDCALTLVSEQDALKRKIPALRYQRQCPRRLFSPGCGVNKTEWATLAQVTDISGKTITSPVFGTKPDGFFTAGWVDGGGTSMAIIKHVGDVLTLFYPIKGLAVWDNVIVYPGCQGTETDCADKFNNLPNHLGYSRIPFTNPFGQGGIN
jgi:uncharacterized phage protein (TIGR02218 family)